MKKLLILGAGFEQGIVIKFAQELGYEVIAVDGSKHAEGLKIANVGIVADINDVEEMCKIGKNFSVHGVMTHGVEIPDIVSKIALKLNLPHLAPEIATLATNKLFRLQCFQKNNVPCPKFIFTKSKNEAISKTLNMKFPLVIKPTDNSGSRGILKINSAEEISEKYDEALTFSKNSTIIIEEFLTGPQISTESIIVNNKIITTGFADRNYDKLASFEPYFIEDGHTIPSTLSVTLKNKVLNVVNDAINSLGINFGVAKGDILIHDGHPIVLEMAARTSGGRFATDMVPLSSGANILKPLIQMSIGDDIDMNFLDSTLTRSAAQRFFFPKPGKLVSINGLEEAKKIPGVHDIYIKPNLLGTYIKKVTNHSERVGYVIASGKTRNNAISIAEKVIKTIKFVTI